MSCIPGSPKTGGRKKGTPNKCRKSIDYFAEQVFKKVDMVQEGIELLRYQKDPRVRAMVWCRLMDYKFGRPREQLIVSGSLDMRSVIAQARERALSVLDATTSKALPSNDLTSENRQALDSGRSGDDSQVVDSIQQ